MKILKYKIAGALYQAETGPEAQVGDQVKMFLDTAANPELPEFVFGIIQPGIKKSGCCDDYTIYPIGYELEEFTLHGDDVLSVETTAAVDVVAEDLAAEVAARIAADSAESAARIADVNAEEAARIAADALKAPLASPVFTGNPTAPTPSTSDSDTSVATTAFVQAQPAVRYTSQTLTDPQKLQARTNVGVVNVDFTNYSLINGVGDVSIDWDNGVLQGFGGTPAVGWSSSGLNFLGDNTGITIASTTGMFIGENTTQKLAFHGITPVAQRAGAAQAAVATTASTLTTPYGYTTQAQADGVITLLNEIRAALVQKGLIKGSA